MRTLRTDWTNEKGRPICPQGPHSPYRPHCPPVHINFKTFYNN